MDGKDGVPCVGHQWEEDGKDCVPCVGHHQEEDGKDGVPCAGHHWRVSYEEEGEEDGKDGVEENGKDGEHFVSSVGPEFATASSWLQLLTEPETRTHHGVHLDLSYK